MIHLTAGTDAATLILWDPAALPNDAQRRFAAGYKESQRLLADLGGAGQIWVAEPGGDGSYLAHLFVDEEPPAVLLSYAMAVSTIPAFPVPSGQLVFAGAEFFAQRDTTRAIATGTSVQLAPGTYNAAFHELDCPEELLETRMASATTLWERRLLSAPLYGCAWTFVFAAFAAVSWYLSFSASWHWLLLAMAAVAIVATLAATRSPQYRRAITIQHDLERDYPSYAIVLRRREA